MVVDFDSKSFSKYCFDNVYGFYFFAVEGDTSLVFLVFDVGIYNLADGDYTTG